MLKEMREQDDPMLAVFEKALYKQGYAPMTRKSYKWHAKAFLDYCDQKNTSPKRIAAEKLEQYFRNIDREVGAKKKSYPFFLQSCTALEILFRTVFKDGRRARSIPRLRKKITAQEVSA